MLVIGNAVSGKTSFSSALAKKLDLVHIENHKLI